MPTIWIFKETRIRTKIKYKYAIKQVLSSDSEFNDNFPNDLRNKDYNQF